MGWEEPNKPIFEILLKLTYVNNCISKEKQNRSRPRIDERNLDDRIPPNTQATKLQRYLTIEQLKKKMINTIMFITEQTLGVPCQFFSSVIFGESSILFYWPHEKLDLQKDYFWVKSLYAYMWSLVLVVTLEWFGGFCYAAHQLRHLIKWNQMIIHCSLV